MPGTAPRGHNILFVDDEESIRITLPAILRKAGFEVTVAQSVQEALIEINSQRFDALISDLNISEPGRWFPGDFRYAPHAAGMRECDSDGLSGHRNRSAGDT